MQQLYVGVGRAEIIPPMGTRMQGYTPAPVCTSVHDPVHVTVFVLQCGEIRAVVAAADMCNIGGDNSTVARQALAKGAGVPFEHVILGCTHTHSGPHAGHPEDAPFDFMQEVFCPNAEKAAAEAAANLRPAQMGIGTTHSTVAVNRRQLKENGKVVLGQDPAGTWDPTMTVIAFREPDGTPIGNLIHYGCHNTASGRTFGISRDWSGVMIDRLEAQSGGVTAYINGCGGDCGPRLPNGKTIGDVPMAMELGGQAGIDAVRAWNNIKMWQDVPVKVLSGQIVLPYDDIGTPEEAEAKAHAMGDPEELKQRKGPYISRYNKLLERAEYIRQGNIPPTEQVIDHTVIALGPLVFQPIPFEPFSRITLRIKEHSPFPYTVCVGYANGSYGYFPSMDQIIRGGYEVEMFQNLKLVPYVNDAEQYYLDGSLALLRKLYKKE